MGVVLSVKLRTLCAPERLGDLAVTGFTLDNLVSDTFFGERELVKLAFGQSATATNGLIVTDAGDNHGTPPTAQAITLNAVTVPNTLHRGLNANKEFAVAAVDVRGQLAQRGKDVYSFIGRAGDVLNLEVMTGRLTGGFDSVVKVYNSAACIACL